MSAAAHLSATELVAIIAGGLAAVSACFVAVIRQTQRSLCTDFSCCWGCLTVHRDVSRVRPQLSPPSETPRYPEVNLQRILRGPAPPLVDDGYDEEDAAVKIQSIYRGRQTRRQLSEMV